MILIRVFVRKSKVIRLKGLIVCWKVLRNKKALNPWIMSNLNEL